MKRPENYEISSDVEWKKEGNSIILLDFNTGDFFKLNSTAAKILEGLSSDKSLSKIQEDLVESYDTTPKECGLSLKKFIDKLSKMGIIKSIKK